MLGSKLWSCSDLEKGYNEIMNETPAAAADLRRRIQDTSHSFLMYISQGYHDIEF